MGRLDKKVAESPDVEKKEPVQASPAEDARVEPAERIALPISKKEDEPAVQSQKEKTIQLKSETGVAAVESEAEIIVEEILEEETAREELAEIQIEEAADISKETLMAKEEVHVDEVAAPAMVMDKQAAARSRKRELAKPAQMAGVEGREQRIISGMVVSGEDEQPLPGVIVAIKGSNTGIVTNLEGRFEISIGEDSNNTLIAQYIGMETKEIPVLDQEEYRITMQPDASSLEEVVVIGTGPGKIPQPVGYTVNLAEFDANQGKSAFRGALPVGGKKKFNEYVQRNMKFPENEEGLTRAVVVLTFVVGYDGKPGKVFVLKSPGKVFSEEAIRLLMEGPDWEPAEMDGKYSELPNRIRMVINKE
jgi:hypothetical protein